MFDATQFAGQETGNKVDRSPIPEGNYTAKMTSFERRVMKSGNGEMLNVEFTVDVGSAARKCWHNFNMTHTNPKTVEIAFQQMGNLCIAAGYNSIQDPWNPVELIDKEVGVYMTVNERGYNEIKAFKTPETSSTDAANKLYGGQPTAQSSAPATNTDDEIPF